jgi:hypothetical protein
MMASFDSSPETFDESQWDVITLQLLYQDPNPDFLITGGVKRGVALHFVTDIEDWLQ